jgi:hypothetical protein
MHFSFLCFKIRTVNEKRDGCNGQKIPMKLQKLVQMAKALGMQQTLLKHHKHACNLENLLMIRRQSHDAVKPNSFLKNKKWPASYN